VTVFVGRAGEQRWFCHGCGNGGTAIDLVMQVRGVSAREALEELAGRVGVPIGAERTKVVRRHDERGRRVLTPVYSTPEPVADVERYVGECEAALWTPAGEPVRRWLVEGRGLPEEVLRVNRVGVDLGRRRQWRPDGVPEVDIAAVLPVLVRGEACYAQLRLLNGRGLKYLGVRSELAENPRLGICLPAPGHDDPKRRPEVLVTEGIIDGLSAAAAGYSAVALLGAKYAGADTAIPLARLERPLVVALDPDAAGEQAVERLAQFLRARHRDPSVLRLRDGDLNDHLVRSGDWPVELAARVEHATFRRPGAGLVRDAG
jgi:DNA primase